VSIQEAFCVYTEAAKQSIIRAKHGKFSELRISEMASADFSGIAQQTLVLQSPGLLDMFHCPCIIRMVMFIDISPTLSTCLSRRKSSHGRG